MMRKPVCLEPACLAVLTALIVFAGTQVAQVNAQTRATCRYSSSTAPGRRCRRSGSSAIPPASASTRRTMSGCCTARARSSPSRPKMAAPAIMVFDAAGNFIKAWGGDGAGFEWPEREHGIHIDHKGFVWVGGNNCAARDAARAEAGRGRPAPEVHAGRQVRAADRQAALEQGQCRHRQPASAGGRLGPPADQRTVRRRRLRQPPRHRARCRYRQVQADVGRVRQQAGGQGRMPAAEPHDGAARQPGPDQFSIVHAIRVSSDGMVYVADRENRRVQTFTLDGKFIKQLVSARRAVRAQPRAVAGSASSSSSMSAAAPTSWWSTASRSRSSARSRAAACSAAATRSATDSKGNIYVAATGRGMQKLTFKGVAPAATR